MSRINLPDHIIRTAKRIKLWHMLQDGGRFTNLSASLAVGLDIRTADAFLKILHDERLIHVAGWTRNGDRGPKTKLFAFGTGIDAPFPTKLDGAFCSKRWRDRHPEQSRQSHAATRLRRKIREGKAPVGNDPLLMAIMGGAQ